MSNIDKSFNIYSDRIRVLYDREHGLVQITVYSIARMSNNTVVETLVANFTLTKDLLAEGGLLLDEKKFHLLVPDTEVKKKDDKMSGMVS